MTPNERAGLRQAIANDNGTAAWPSKTITELLDDLDTAHAQIQTMARALQAGALDVTEPAREIAGLKAELDEAVAQIKGLEGNFRAIRGWTRSRLEILQQLRPNSSTTTAKIAILDDLNRVLDHLSDPPPSPEQLTDTEEI